MDETVGLQLVITPEGKVMAATVFTKSTPLLAEAATAAVKQWEYEPTLMQGIPVYAIVVAAVRFTQ